MHSNSILRYLYFTKMVLLVIFNFYMKKFLLLLLLSNCVYSQVTLRVSTYNLLNYFGTDRTQYFHTIINAMHADIILVQEMMNQAAVDSFKLPVYETIPFHDGPDTDNHFYYKRDKVEYLEAKYISTSLRDIARYKVRLLYNDEIIYLFSTHLKASSGQDNEQRRLEECTTLTNNLVDSTNYIVVGDMNFYSSSEPGYQKLLTKLYDPLNEPGNWHNNANFAGIHTQSTRVEDFGGGATGGLDDRFDFILVSQSLQDNVESSTYTELGNDGAHFNLSINNGENDPVSNALYYASDHLPVYCDFVFPKVTAIAENPNIPAFKLYQNFPNPFNPKTVITFYLPQFGHVNLSVYNTIGQEIAVLINENMSAGKHAIPYEPMNRASGVYYYKIQCGNKSYTKKMLFIK